MYGLEVETENFLLDSINGLFVLTTSLIAIKIFGIREIARNLTPGFKSRRTKSTISFHSIVQNGLEGI